jgi:hypothetical protein
MKKIRWAFIIFFLAAGCQKSDSSSQVLPPENDSTSSQVLFPNRVGDEWHYLVNDTAIHNSGFDSSVVISKYDVDVAIVGRVRLANNAIATIWQYRYPNSTDTNYVYQSGDSILFLDRTKFQRPKVYLTPFAVGSNWLCLQGELDFKKVVSQGTITIGDSTYTDSWEIMGSTTLPDAFYYIDERFKYHIGFINSYYNNSGAFINTVNHTTWSLISYLLK